MGNCIVCGKRFEDKKLKHGGGRTRIYCSDLCNQRAYIERSKKYEIYIKRKMKRLKIEPVIRDEDAEKLIAVKEIISPYFTWSIK